jgi:hypothetical protein
MGKLGIPGLPRHRSFLCLGDKTGDKTLLPTRREWRNF